MTIGGAGRHPADQLIRDLVQTNRTGQPWEVERIIQRLAVAPFDPRVITVPARERGLVYRGRVLLARAESLFVHLVRRVLVDGQLIAGTTPITSLRICNVPSRCQLLGLPSIAGVVAILRRRSPQRSRRSRRGGEDRPGSQNCWSSIRPTEV